MVEAVETDGPLRSTARHLSRSNGAQGNFMQLYSVNPKDGGVEFVVKKSGAGCATTAFVGAALVLLPVCGLFLFPIGLLAWLAFAAWAGRLLVKGKYGTHTIFASPALVRASDGEEIRTEAIDAFVVRNAADKAFEMSVSPTTIVAGGTGALGASVAAGAMAGSTIQQLGQLNARAQARTAYWVGVRTRGRLVPLATSLNEEAANGLFHDIAEAVGGAPR